MRMSFRVGGAVNHSALEVWKCLPKIKQAAFSRLFCGVGMVFKGIMRARVRF